MYVYMHLIAQYSTQNVMNYLMAIIMHPLTSHKFAVLPLSRQTLITASL